jgi:Outer mitochondrial membrane transport complex protein
MDPILLELFILPPFCDLPSISGSCIAALSLCTVAVPSSTLRVIETSDLTLAPPALRRGKHWYRGFTAIKHFLDREWDIDPALSPEQKAEAVAWESLVQDIGESLAVPTPLPPSFVRMLIGTVDYIVCFAGELSWGYETGVFSFSPVSTQLYAADGIAGVCSSSVRGYWVYRDVG